MPPSTSSQPSGSRGEIQRYFVVDSTDALQKFGADAWERVVCVMTTGQAWQFRPYRWNEPRTLFHHGAWFCLWLTSMTDDDAALVKGICLSWASDPPNAKIKDWNVTELKVTLSLLLLFAGVNAPRARSILTDGILISRWWLISGSSSMTGRSLTSRG